MQEEINKEETEQFEYIEDDDSEDDDRIFNEIDYGCDNTLQNIISEYHNKEYNLKILLDYSVDIDNITNKYLEIIDLEKKEAIKSLRDRGYEAYIKLL